MRVFFFMWAGLAALACFSGQPVQAATYSQSYTILINGVPAGSEVVTEKHEGGNIISSSEHEIFVTDGTETKRMAFVAKTVLSKDSSRPVSYTCRYTSGGSDDSYEVQVDAGHISRTLTRGGHTSEVSVPLRPDTVILDFNVYHQYDHLIRRYDSRKGGRQMFADFLPVIGSDIPIALTSLGSGTIPHPNGMLNVKHFRIEFINIFSGTLSVDEHGRLVRLIIPAQELEVLRSDLSAMIDHGRNR